MLTLGRISTVSIVNRQAFPLSRQLDAEAGEMVLNKITALGVQVLTRSYPTGHTIKNSTDGSDDQVFTGLCLNDGTTHYADMVIYAIGIVPRDEIAHSSGIECHSRRGIIVDDQLKTSADDVYAIGECANWGGNTYGLIAPGGQSLQINNHASNLSMYCFKSRWQIFLLSTLRRQSRILRGR